MLIHGMARTLTYKSWLKMKERCNCKTSNRYNIYGERGISICKKWESFESFYEDMGERPNGKTLDRIDNDGNYFKENCRWATPKQQSNNRRTNHLITHKGETHNLNEWADIMGIKRKTLQSRITQYKWPIIKALST